MNLYPHQQKIVDRNPKRHLLAHSTGTGKTITALALAEKNCRTCLIVCPKMLKEMWQRETKTHGKQCVYRVLTKEEFKKHAKDLPAVHGIIIDEGHTFAGEHSQLSKLMQFYLKKHNIEFRWICTATPYLSTPMNIYMLAKHLGVEYNYWTFRKKFFNDVNMGGRMVPVVKKGIEKELALIVQQIGSTVDMAEVVEVPEQTFETEYFETTKEQDIAISQLEESQFITQWTKTHTIENGLLYGDEYTKTRTFDCAKNARIVELCNEHKKVAIFCRYNIQIDVLADLIGQETGKPIYIITGATPDRDQAIRNADGAEEAIIIIQAMCSAGYELPSFPLIIFASLSFSHVDHIQAQGRFLRINKLKPNRYIYLVVKGVDEDVYDCIMKKQDFDIAIYGRERFSKKIQQVDKVPTLFDDRI